MAEARTLAEQMDAFFVLVNDKHLCSSTITYAWIDLRKEIEAALERAQLAEPLVWALEDDHRHGNLTGRTEDAWYSYQAALARVGDTPQGTQR